jgi:hypothetical protein
MFKKLPVQTLPLGKKQKITTGLWYLTGKRPIASKV